MLRFTITLPWSVISSTERLTSSVARPPWSSGSNNYASGDRGVQRRRVRIGLTPPPVRYNGRHAASRRAYAIGGQHAQQVALRAHDPDFASIYLHPLGKRAQMVAAVAAAIETDALPRS